MRIDFKKMLLTVLFVLVTGAVLSGCGFSYGYHFSTNTLNKADAKEFTVEKQVVDPITEVEIHTSVAEVELIPADDFYVEIDYLYWEDEPEYELKDGKLYFNDEDALPNNYSINFNLDNTIRVYLPQDSKLGKVLIKNSSGDVNIAGFITDDLRITVSYGDFTMEKASAAKAGITLSSGVSNITDFEVGDLDFKNSYGNAEFTRINTATAKLPEGVTGESFDVNMSSGDVTIDGLKSKSIDITNSYGDINSNEITANEFDTVLSSGDLTLKAADIKDMDVNDSYGDADLYLLGDEADYSLDLDTSYGNIKVGDDKYEEHVVLNETGTRKVNANLSSGDVTVLFTDK